MTEPITACPVCASTKIEHAFTKDDHGFSRCADCHLIFIDPTLPQSDLSEIYRAREDGDDRLRYPFDKGAHRRSRARRRAWRLRRFFKGKDVLDIGCGGGFMTDAMMRQGARRATGIDLDGGAINFAKVTHHRQAEFYNETLADYADRGQAIDFLHSSQVIEHVGDLEQFVGLCAKLLRPGGRMYIKSPDRKDWQPGSPTPNWPGPPDYVHYFDRKALTTLLEKHGLQARHSLFSFKSSLQIVAAKPV